MQFADKAQHGLGLRDASQQERTDVLFFGSFEALPFAPATPAEQQRILGEVHRACREARRMLRLRLHPRYPKSSWAPFVDELSNRYPGTIGISTDPSISRDLLNCVCAVASVFDGAVMDALLAGLPVVSYIPNDITHHEQTRLLEVTGGVIRDYPTLKSLLSAEHDAYEWKELRAAQQVFLDSYFDRSQQDPWTRAVALIDEARIAAG